MAKQEKLPPSPTQLAELTALADGSLEPGRRHAVEEWIAASPEVRALYERERAAVRVLRRAAADRAPARLRMGLDRQRASRATRSRRRPAYAAFAGALAAVVAALALLLPGGAPGSPSVSQAAQLALRGPSGPAPAADPTNPELKLAQRIEGLYFPNWSTTLGWRPVGMRSDELEGRQAITVYYQRQAVNVAYTIVGLPALPWSSAPMTHVGRLALQSFSLGGRSVVTWRRAGHTCVLSASGVSTWVLEKLADWSGARVGD